MFSSLLSWEMGGGRGVRWGLGFCFCFFCCFWSLKKKKIPLLSNRMLPPPLPLIQRAVFVSLSRLLL